MKTTEEAMDLIEEYTEETERTTKELILVAAICTIVGIVIGFFIGKTTTSKNTIKKYNKCYTYDFGDEE